MIEQLQLKLAQMEKAKAKVNQSIYIYIFPKIGNSSYGGCDNLVTKFPF